MAKFLFSFENEHIARGDINWLFDVIAPDHNVPRILDKDVLEKMGATAMGADQ